MDSMQCPNCQADYLASDEFCRECGADLPSTVTSTSLVPVRSNLPAVLQHPQLPRIAAGVGAVAVGFGLELLRRGLVARKSRMAVRLPSTLLPDIMGGVKEMFSPQQTRTAKLPKGYEIHETAIYISRVIRREHERTSRRCRFIGHTADSSA